MTTGKPMRIIVGITGASGVILGVDLLRALAQHAECETHLVMTDSARRTLRYETDVEPEQVIALADHFHAIDDMAAAISSGSFRTDGMIVMPCSMKTLAGVVTGYTDNLLLRAVDVCLKERRRVILVPRELPLSAVHLRNLVQASNDGCIIMPPMLTFYNRPETIQHMINHLVGKIMAMFGLAFAGFVPWTGLETPSQ
jgi:4-hydroxy-3-polyprenylbenzoate decarboxylase